MKPAIVLLVFLAFFSLKVSSQNDVIFIPQIDALVQDQIKEGAPKCVIGVIKDGAFIHKKAYGLANLDYDIPLTTSSVFRIAFNSKQFTAACIFYWRGKVRSMHKV